MKSARSRAIWLRLVALGALGLVACVPPEGEQPAPNTGTGTAAGPRPKGGNLIKMSGFDGATFLPWTSSFSQPGEGDAYLENGWFCTKVRNPGTNKWDAQMRHREMTIYKNHKYTLQLKIKADKHTRAQIKIGAQSGWPEYYVNTLDLTETPQTVVGTFSPGDTMKDGTEDKLAELAIHLGGGLPQGVTMPMTICIDDVYLIDPEYTPGKEQVVALLPPLRINQVGYFPFTDKFAAMVSKSSTPLDWELDDAQGKSVNKGKSTPFAGGTDESSGDSVHWIDFSSTAAPGTGYTLKVGTDQSPPFEIGKGIYHKLKYEALHYFYHNRAGIDLKMPWAGDAKWERPAGIKDNAVPCAKTADCDYTLDVSGGWYDAGRSRQIRGQRRDLRVDADEPVGAHPLSGVVQGRFRRRQAQHPRGGEQGARPPRRGPLGAGVHAPHAGPGRQADGGHGPPQDPRRRVDGARHAAGQGHEEAAAPAREHRGHPEPGGHRRAGRPHLPRLRQAVRRQVPRRRREGVGRGQGPPRQARPADRQPRRRPLRRQRPHATRDTGRRPSSTSPPRSPSTSTR